MADPHVDVQADGSGWGLESVAWTLDGQEVSRCEMDTSGGRHQWHLSNASTRLQGDFSFETDSEGENRFVGTLNGQSYIVPLGEGAQAASVEPLELDAAQETLVAQWAPLLYDLGGLLDIVAPENDGAAAGPGKCAVAGALTITGCVAFGVFACDAIVDAAVDWCTS